MPEHIFIVKVGGCTDEQAHTVMTERLGFDESYGFDYTLDWDEAQAASPERAREVALSIASVQTATFTKRHDGTLTGVVYDNLSGVEYDIRFKDGAWIANDDHGRDFANSVLETALLAAIEANRN